MANLKKIQMVADYIFFFLQNLDVYNYIENWHCIKK